MIKAAAGEELVKLFNRRYTEGSINRKEAMLYASQATNMVIRNYIWKQLAEDDRTVPYYFLKEYTNTAIFDPNRLEWYVEIPIRTLDMLGHDRGIYHVFPEYQEEELMVPTTPGYLGMYSGLAADGLEGRLSYRPIRNRLYINKTDVGDDFNITMRLIPDSESLGQDEELPLPPDGEAEMLQIAMNLLRVKFGIKEDSVIDNTNR